jgi:hypothetical protein
VYIHVYKHSGASMYVYKHSGASRGSLREANGLQRAAGDSRRAGPSFERSTCIFVYNYSMYVMIYISHIHTHTHTHIR